MEFIFNDKALAVAAKPPGMPVQPDPTGAQALLNLAQETLGQTLFLVHRLDRPVSGLVLMAKSPQTAHVLSEQFRARTVIKTYLAVVPLYNGPESGILVHYLAKNTGQNKTKVFSEPKEGTQKAELSFRVHKHLERYSILELQLHSGRHHQIRAQLAAIGLPVKGDVKYGAKRGNPDRSIHLHAWKIGFEHPIDLAWIELCAPPPQSDPIWATVGGPA